MKPNEYETKADLDTPYGYLEGIPAKFTAYVGERHILHSLTIGEQTLTREQVVNMTSEAEVRATEETADEQYLEELRAGDLCDA